MAPTAPIGWMIRGSSWFPRRNVGGSPAPKRRDYSHLPVRIEELDVADDAKVCACRGLPLEPLGHNTDSEQIEIETLTYRRVMRRKRYRRICECVDQPRTITALLPAKLLPKIAQMNGDRSDLALRQVRDSCRTHHEIVRQPQAVDEPSPPMDWEAAWV